MKKATPIKEASVGQAEKYRFFMSKGKFQTNN